MWHMWAHCSILLPQQWNNAQRQYQEKKEKKRNQELCLQPRGIITHFQITAIFNKHVYSDDEWEVRQMSEGGLRCMFLMAH